MNWYYFMGAWLFFALAGLWVVAMTEDRLMVKDLIIATLFAPLYFFIAVCYLDAVVWKK